MISPVCHFQGIDRQHSMFKLEVDRVFDEQWLGDALFGLYFDDSAKASIITAIFHQIFSLGNPNKIKEQPKEKELFPLLRDAIEIIAGNPQPLFWRPPEDNKYIGFTIYVTKEIGKNFFELMSKMQALCPKRDIEVLRETERNPLAPVGGYGGMLRTLLLGREIYDFTKKSVFQRNSSIILVIASFLEKETRESYQHMSWDNKKLAPNLTYSIRISVV